MNEYFFHGKAYLDSGAYREVSLVVKAESAIEAHNKAVKMVIDDVELAHGAVFVTMTKQ